MRSLRLLFVLIVSTVLLSACGLSATNPVVPGSFTAEEVAEQATAKLKGQFGGYDITVNCPEGISKDQRAATVCVLNSRGTRLNVNVTVTEVNKSTGDATLGFRIGSILPDEETTADENPSSTTTAAPLQALDAKPIASDPAKTVSADNVKAAVEGARTQLGLQGYEVFCESLTSTIGDTATCWLEQRTKRFEVTVVVDRFDATTSKVHFTIGDPVATSDH